MLRSWHARLEAGAPGEHCSSLEWMQRGLPEGVLSSFLASYSCNIAVTGSALLCCQCCPLGLEYEENFSDLSGTCVGDWVIACMPLCRSCCHAAVQASANDDKPTVYSLLEPMRGFEHSFEHSTANLGYC